MKNTLLQGKQISRIFKQGKSENRVLDHVDVDIYEKDYTIIMGSSGAGKSTLLYALSGMDAVDEGEVIYRGMPIHALKEREMAMLRAEEFGFIFQQTHLVSNLTLYENVAVAGYVSGSGDGAAIRQRTEQLLGQMGVATAADRLPAQVSGGEAQRAAIARAMIGEPGLIFADEPTGALNRAHSSEVLGLLTELNRAGQSILMVTHDLRAAVRGNRILYLEDGRIIDEFILQPFLENAERQRERVVSEWLARLRW